MPIGKAITAAAAASSSELPTAPKTSSATGRPEAIERPISPCSRLPTQIRYCTGTGLSKPYAARIAACCSAVASTGMMAVSGSPGAICTSAKQTTDTPKATGSTRIRRRRK